MAAPARGSRTPGAAFSSGSLDLVSCRTLIPALVAVLFFPAIAAAQVVDSARLIGLSDAQRALGNTNDAIYVNPAGLALGRAYSIEAGYLDDIRGSDRRFNASIVDSQAGPVAGGIGYTYSSRRPDDVAAGEERLKGHRLDLSAATRLAEGLAIGMTTRYLRYGRKEGDVEQEGFDVFTMDVGLQWRLAESLSMGLVGYNLTNNERKELPIGWGAGIGYVLGAFSIESDIRYNAQIGEPRYSAGAGFVIGNLVPLRAGFSYDRADRSIAVSGGLGLTSDRFAVDVGYRQRVSGDFVEDDDDQRILGVSIRTRAF